MFTTRTYPKTHRRLALTLVLSLILVVVARTSDVPLPEPPSATEVVGSAPLPQLACIGCVAGGVFLTFGGWGGVLAAAGGRGSALAAMGCVVMCRRAIVR